MPKKTSHFILPTHYIIFIKRSQWVIDENFSNIHVKIENDWLIIHGIKGYPKSGFIFPIKICMMLKSTVHRLHLHYWYFRNSLKYNLHDRRDIGETNIMVVFFLHRLHIIYWLCLYFRFVDFFCVVQVWVLENVAFGYIM